MPSSPQSSPPTSSAVERSYKGLFNGGVWHCNCMPRLKAVVRTVRKNNQNKGRTFYVCPVEKNEGNRCDFYLWSEDAREREKESLMSNNQSELKSPPKKQMTLHESMSARKEKRKSGEVTKLTKLSDLPSVVKGESSRASKPVPEPASTNKSSATAASSTLKAESTSTSSRSERTLYDDTTESEDDDDEVVEVTPSKGKGVVYNKPQQSSAMAKPAATPSAGSKRKRNVDDDDLLDDLSSGAEEELIVMTDKSTRFKDTYATPSAARTVKVENGMPTPSFTDKGKSVRRVLFQEPEVTESNGPPSAKRQRLEEPVDATPSGKGTDVRSSSNTPTPGADMNLTQEAIAIFKDGNVSKAEIAALRKLLDAHVARAKGFEQGRNVAREALKKSEAKAAQLQSKITHLESTRSLMRTSLLDIYQKH